MEKTTKTTKKKKGSVSVHLRVSRGTHRWLESQIDEEKDSVPAVAREIIDEKKRAAQKPPTGG